MSNIEHKAPVSFLGERLSGRLKFYVVLFCMLALIASLIGNIVLYRYAQTFYRQARSAALFPTNENRYRDMNKLLPPKTMKRVVLFGDSRIEQWSVLPATSNVEFINRGIAGETTVQMRARFEQDVLRLDPDVVILQLGINDLTTIGVLQIRKQAIVSQCASNIRYFVEALLAKNIQTIFLTIIPPANPGIFRLPIWSDEIASAVKSINGDWLDRSVSKGLQVVDTRGLLQDGSGHWLDNVNVDTLHLTSKGYAYLNRELVPLLPD